MRKGWAAGGRHLALWVSSGLPTQWLDVATESFDPRSVSSWCSWIIRFVRNLRGNGPQGQWSSHPHGELLASLIVQGEVQLQHIHARFPQDSKLAGLKMLLDQSPQLVLGEIPLSGDARHLKIGSGGGDVGVKAGS